MTRALIMAGGQGARMRAAGASTPKPLVSIGGIPLLERNLRVLLQSGFPEIAIAVPSQPLEIAEFAGGRCRLLAARSGAHLSVFQETRPLGNIGAAAEIEGRGDLLVTYADNLTALDLNALVSHHHASGAALTTAVHLEPFQIPFGEVAVEGGKVLAYVEKPERRILVSSGLFVLSPQALRYLPRGLPAGVSWLANRLLSRGETIAAFQHDAPWIDVNDVAAVARAEQLLADHPGDFALQDPPLDLAVQGEAGPRAGNGPA